MTLEDVALIAAQVELQSYSPSAHRLCDGWETIFSFRLGTPKADRSRPGVGGAERPGVVEPVPRPGVIGRDCDAGLRPGVPGVLRADAGPRGEDALGEEEPFGEPLPVAWNERCLGDGNLVGDVTLGLASFNEVLDVRAAKAAA